MEGNGGGSQALKDLVVISGFSGAGKSSAISVFEDLGYFCVDNLPPKMIRSLADLFHHDGSSVQRAAVVCDPRGGEYFAELTQTLDSLRQNGVRFRLIFLAADDQTLLTRYKQTRRRHPLAPEGAVADGIAREHELLAPIRDRADLCIDTTDLTPAKLRSKLVTLIGGGSSAKLAISFISFGHQNGPPRDADLVFDVRFLNNPYYEPELQALTGFDPDVVEFIVRDQRLEEFYQRVYALLDYLLPQYVAEGKAHLVIAIGCTGGRHRSVVVAEQMAQRYRDAQDYVVSVQHRDVER